MESAPTPAGLDKKGKGKGKETPAVKAPTPAVVVVKAVPTPKPASSPKPVAAVPVVIYAEPKTPPPAMGGGAQEALEAAQLAARLQAIQAEVDKNEAEALKADRIRAEREVMEAHRQLAEQERLAAEEEAQQRNEELAAQARDEARENAMAEADQAAATQALAHNLAAAKVRAWTAQTRAGAALPINDAITFDREAILRAEALRGQEIIDERRKKQLERELAAEERRLRPKAPRKPIKQILQQLNLNLSLLEPDAIKSDDWYDVELAHAARIADAREQQYAARPQKHQPFRQYVDPLEAEIAHAQLIVDAREKQMALYLERNGKRASLEIVEPRNPMQDKLGRLQQERVRALKVAEERAAEFARIAALREAKRNKRS